MRIAVPDGNFPDKDYINYVKPEGTGFGSDDHKILYTCDMLENELQKVGFTTNLLEYWDEKGEFHFNEWNIEDGKVTRSKRFDDRNKTELKYTSLIIDAIK